MSVLTDEKMEQFLFQLEKESQRNKCIGYLLLYTGLRITEIVEIELAHIDRLTAQLKVRGKGGKHREVPLRKDVLEQVQCYVRGERTASKHSTSETLLLSQRGPKLHRDAIRRGSNRQGSNLAFTSIHTCYVKRSVQDYFVME